MDSSRIVKALALILVVGGLAGPRGLEADDKIKLKSAHKIGDTTRVSVSLDVGGDLNLVTEGKQKRLPMSVVARLAYDEQWLAIGSAGKPTRAARYYDSAQAVIKVDKGGEKPSLDARRRLIAVERREDGAIELVCPQSKLIREELDLIDVPGNSFIVDELLPSEPVAPGDSWKLADRTVASLVGVDAVSWSDVQSVLGDVAAGQANIATAGSISGAVGGVSTEIELKAKYRFDLKLKRITYLALLIKEKRAVGHIGPGLDTVAKVVVEIKPVSNSEHLTAAVVADLPKGMTPERAQLSYASPGGPFRVDYDRRWYVTSDEPKLVVMRLVDRGELVAQCNISPLPVQSKPVKLAEFQRDVRSSLGKNFGQFVNAAETTNEAGHSVLRVVVQGVVANLPIEWIYYLVSDQRGQRVSVAFTLEESLRERFARADRALVSELRLLEPPTPTAAKPTAKR